MTRPWIPGTADDDLKALADVAAEPDDLARLELGDDRGLELVHRQVEVDDGAAFDDVA